MEPATGTQPCQIADVLHALSQSGHTKFLIDVDGKLPPAVLAACGAVRPVVWGDRAALSQSTSRAASVMQIEQRPQAAPALSAQVLGQAVVHVALDAAAAPGAASIPPWLSEALQLAAFVVVTQPAEAAAQAPRGHATEQLAEILRAAGVGQALVGHHAAVAIESPMPAPHALALCGQHATFRRAEPKRVLALVSTFNDIDIIVDTIEHLWAQGVDVHVIDNWSTDGTWAILEALFKAAPNKMVGLERYPAQQPDAQYDWHGILARKEAIGLDAGYDWYLHYDSDELRVAPWPNVTLADAISHIDAMGYNAIDHTLIDFRPTKDGFDAKSRAETFFRHFAFNPRPGAFSQIKGWAAQSGPVHLPLTGGHAVQFPGRRVFPLKFLLKHYPLRSSAQAQRKVYLERLPRFAAEQAARGWHGHYAQFGEDVGQSFLWNPKELHYFEDGSFEQKFLVERLFGLGFARDAVASAPLSGAEPRRGEPHRADGGFAAAGVAAPPPVSLHI